MVLLYFGLLMALAKEFASIRFLFLILNGALFMQKAIKEGACGVYTH